MPHKYFHAQPLTLLLYFLPQELWSTQNFQSFIINDSNDLHVFLEIFYNIILHKITPNNLPRLAILLYVSSPYYQLVFVGVLLMHTEYCLYQHQHLNMFPCYFLSFSIVTCITSRLLQVEAPNMSQQESFVSRIDKTF